MQSKHNYLKKFKRKNLGQFNIRQAIIPLKGFRIKEMFTHSLFSVTFEFCCVLLSLLLLWTEIRSPLPPTLLSPFEIPRNSLRTICMSQHLRPVKMGVVFVLEREIKRFVFKNLHWPFEYLK